MKDIAQPIETAYRSAHSGADRRLFQRGRFWAELDIARWLLHGMDSGNEDVVRDATDLINQLHDRVGHDLDNALTEPITQTPHPLHRENPNDG
jgi:macrolide phosphotransferase